MNTTSVIHYYYSLWSPIKGGERRRAVEAGRWGFRPGGQSLRAQASWGGDNMLQQESEAESNGGIWGSNTRQGQGGGGRGARDPETVKTGGAGN